MCSSSLNNSGFLKEKKLINTENLSALENARIGIEGNQWVRNLPLSEPFQIAMGGVPLTLQSVISRELDHFKYESFIINDHVLFNYQKKKFFKNQSLFSSILERGISSQFLSGTD